ncbi:hypothetical protein ZWY2020_010184 [Hordeum vulgare]|nr:hypothetical protein ZWY2020_010184 [Hordeum vulgare]
MRDLERRKKKNQRAADLDPDPLPFATGSTLPPARAGVRPRVLLLLPVEGGPNTPDNLWLVLHQGRGITHTS